MCARDSNTSHHSFVTRTLPTGLLSSSVGIFNCLKYLFYNVWHWFVFLCEYMSYVFMWMHVCAPTCECIFMQRSEASLAIHFQAQSVFSGHKVFLTDLEFTKQVNRLGWLVSKPQGSTCLCFLRVEIASSCHQLWPCHTFSEVWTLFLLLSKKALLTELSLQPLLSFFFKLRNVTCNPLAHEFGFWFWSLFHLMNLRNTNIHLWVYFF